MTTVCAEAGIATQIAAAAASAKAIFFICPPSTNAGDNVPPLHPVPSKTASNDANLLHFGWNTIGAGEPFIILCANDRKEGLKSVIER